mmetsp:Transcript_122943/g.348465  ORF Transcript_122943/g.348465 Transcript_122943/m.348465 type:complete len:289 (-) Transcript_122943:549-1415(-)
MLGRAASSAAESASFAGCISVVWKAAECLSILACKAPVFSASSFSLLIASAVPAQENPFGKSSLAIWQTASFPPSKAAACVQRSASFARSRPATEIIACLDRCAACSIASLRTFNNRSPSSTEKTPAAQSAVYSPTESPHMHWHRVTASDRSCLSFSNPARPAMNMTGWQIFCSSSLDSGPWRQMSMRLRPRISSALLKSARTSGRSFVVDIIFTYCDPWPGNSSPMGRGFMLGAAARARVKSSSSPASSRTSAEPYLLGSRPWCLAAPGRLQYQPFSGFFEPHSQVS